MPPDLKPTITPKPGDRLYVPMRGSIVERAVRVLYDGGRCPRMSTASLADAIGVERKQISPLLGAAVQNFAILTLEDPLDVRRRVYQLATWFAEKHAVALATGTRFDAHNRQANSTTALRQVIVVDGRRVSTKTMGPEARGPRSFPVDAPEASETPDDAEPQDVRVKPLTKAEKDLPVKLKSRPQRTPKPKKPHPDQVEMQAILLAPASPVPNDAAPAVVRDQPATSPTELIADQIKAMQVKTQSDLTPAPAAPGPVPKDESPAAESQAAQAHLPRTMAEHLPFPVPTLLTMPITTPVTQSAPAPEAATVVVAVTAADAEALGITYEPLCGKVVRAASRHAVLLTALASLPIVDGRHPTRKLPRAEGNTIRKAVTNWNKARPTADGKLRSSIRPDGCIVQRVS